MKRFTSKNQKIGEYGETIACKWLEKHGYKIIERNYTKPFGEIDIIASRNSIIYFIEVKSTATSTVSCETMRPEENITKKKIRSCETTILTYLNENSVSHETEWSLSAIIVYIDLKPKKEHKLKFIQNIY